MHRIYRKFGKYKKIQRRKHGYISWPRRMSENIDTCLINDYYLVVACWMISTILFELSYTA